MEYGRSVFGQHVVGNAFGHCCRKGVAVFVHIYELAAADTDFKRLFVAVYIGVSCRNVTALIFAVVSEVIFTPINLHNLSGYFKFNSAVRRYVIVGA